MTTDPQQLRAEIQATREELGDTVQALAEKTDVGAQARRKLNETKASVRGATPDSAAAAAAHATQAARRNPALVVLVAGLVAGFALGRLTAR